MKVEDAIIKLSKLAKLCPKAEVVVRADGSDFYDSVDLCEVVDLVNTESGNMIAPWKDGLKTRQAIRLL